MLAVVAVFFATCAIDEEPDEEDNTTTIDIKVLRDDFFDLAEDKIIGQAKFSEKSGQVGRRIKARVLIETLSRFPDQKIAVQLVLQNQDAAVSVYEPIQWVQDTNEESVEFVIPLVETIPVLLNFRLLAYQYTFNEAEPLKADDDTADDDTIDDDDNDDDDAVDDDTGGDDDTIGDDDTPAPDRIFEAEGIFTFLVNAGQPGTGD